MTSIYAGFLYNLQLSNHIEDVVHTYQTQIAPHLLKDCSPALMQRISNNLLKHDDSRFKDEEWIPYRDYFCDEESKVTAEYLRAKNYHQKHNPHHWQYWCLMDKSGTTPLDIPFEYIIEMLCDWQSSSRSYDSTAYEYYTTQESSILLSKQTRIIVETYIEYLK